MNTIKMYKDVANEYDINPIALKHALKEEGYKPKRATIAEIVQTIYIHAPSLFWTRADSDDQTVEYLDTAVPAMVSALLKEYLLPRENREDAYREKV